MSSILAAPETLNQMRAEYKAEGIGYDGVMRLIFGSKPQI
jgi:hypothetical protein